MLQCPFATKRQTWCLLLYWTLNHLHDRLIPQGCLLFASSVISQISLSSSTFHSASAMGSWTSVPCSSSPSALRLIQLDTCVAALVVKLPWLHVHPNSPVESLVMLPLTGFLRCLVLWILEPFSRNVFCVTSLHSRRKSRRLWPCCAAIVKARGVAAG